MAKTQVLDDKLSAAPQKVYTRDAFEWEFRYRNTVVDTFLIMAPNDEDYMIKLATKLNENAENQNEICEEFKADVKKGEIKPDIIS